MAKTIFVVIKRARQYDGDYVFVSAEKAFVDSQKAEDFWRSQTRGFWKEIIDGVECECERAILPVELCDD
jgi:hypothetical protein